MKKVFYATLALGALIFASCQKENSVELPKVDSPVFTAHIDAGTKTALNAEGTKSEWNEDHIWVLNGDPSNTSWKKEYATTATSGDAATFTEVSSEASLAAGPVVAICPASMGNNAWWNASVDKKVNKLWLKSQQTATVNGYDPEAHIAVAYSETKSLEFKNAVSLLKFTCGSDNISEVWVTANSDANAAESKDVMSGNFDFDTEGKVSTTASYAGSEYVYNYVKITGNLVKGTTYYIACLPTTFTKGFTVEVVSNGIKGDNKTTAKNYELSRNKILNLGEIGYKKTLYLEPNADWLSESAWFAVYFFNKGTGENEWLKMEKVDGTNYYKVAVTDEMVAKYPNLIFCRMNPGKTDLSWESKWSQTGDLAMPKTDNYFTITSWGDGTWSYLSK